MGKPEVPVQSNVEPHQAEPWCRELLGDRWTAIDNRSGRWCVFWNGFRVPKGTPKYTWYFETQEYANWFALRWG